MQKACNSIGKCAAVQILLACQRRIAISMSLGSLGLEGPSDPESRSCAYALALRAVVLACGRAVVAVHAFGQQCGRAAAQPGRAQGPGEPGAWPHMFKVSCS